MAGNLEGVKEVEFKIDKTSPSTIIYTTGTEGDDGWYRSEVKIGLNGLDSYSGYDKTFYSLDNEGNFQEFIDDLRFDQEGKHEIYYFSVDNAGIMEDKKVFEFYIDKTPPEAEISYDLNAEDVLISGKDNLGESSFSENIVTDQAGNTLKLEYHKKKIGKYVKFELKSLKYNDDPEIKIVRNLFFTFLLRDIKSNDVRLLSQHYIDKGNMRIFSHYFLQLNRTNFYIRERGSRQKIIQQSGLVLLKLYTQEGTINYSY